MCFALHLLFECGILCLLWKNAGAVCAERIQKFDNKLYARFGGKLFDDYHAPASRVLPGFRPDGKLRMLLQLEGIERRSSSSSAPRTL